jgi:hypothetical protein
LRWGGRREIGMPLGNLTSQFFANVYLNELDQFIKRELKAKYYIRYVDDFVILHSNKEILNKYKDCINNFLKRNLKIELHPEKSKMILLNRGVTLLGFRVFCYHKLLKKSNLRRFNKKFEEIKCLYSNGSISYDEIYEIFQGLFAYLKHANTFKQRKKIIQGFKEILNSLNY